MPDPSEAPRPRRPWWRTVVVLVAAVLAVVTLWFVAVRSTSPLRAVRIIENEHGNRGPIPDERNMRLRVATWNIAHGRGPGDVSNWSATAEDRRARLEQIAAVLAAENLDLVILNEVDFDCTWSGGVNAAQLIAEAAGFPWWAEQCNIDTGLPFLRWQFGNAVLSRYRIGAAERMDHAPHSVFESIVAGHKRSLVCEVELNRNMLSVMAVHMDPRNKRIAAEAAGKISTFAQDGDFPLFVAGDLNTGKVGRWQDTSGGTALSMLLNSGVLRPDTGYGGRAPNTFPASAPRQRLDWVLSPTDWRVVSSRVLNVQLSDHLPVIVELEAPEVW